MEDRTGWLKELIRDVYDFPKPGVTFKDITPLLSDPDAFAKTVGELAGAFNGEVVDKVLGIEARGFIVAAPVALALGAGFVPVRKAGKLPWQVHAESYQLEYGTDILEMHQDAIGPGERVLIVDDVLATGGTAAAVARMVDHMGADPVGFAFVLELAFLGGRAKLRDRDTFSLVTYE
ncbi:MAG: adenine phosphoribosyltransferase [Acidimicrobiales bacterium]|nr:adenine phosphoribosyltransferase [Acidimicrobiales bacterium]